MSRIKKACENKHCYNLSIPSEDTKILKFNQNQKSDKAPFIIYVDLECILEQINGCKNNPQNLSATKVNKHIPSGFSMSTISSFRIIGNREEITEKISHILQFIDSARFMESLLSDLLNNLFQ